MTASVCRAFVFAWLVLISSAFIACRARDVKSGTRNILLFNGTGTSPNDVAAVEAILKGNLLDHTTVNSSELNAMGESQIRAYRLLIVPGGNFVDIGHSLTPGTTANIRSAVQNGLNYLGICGGAFFAGSFPEPYNGL